MDWGAELGLAAGSHAANAPPAPVATNALYEVVQQGNHDAFNEYGVTPSVGKELRTMFERGDPQLPRAPHRLWRSARPTPSCSASRSL
jgi:hypothetical protein